MNQNTKNILENEKCENINIMNVYEEEIEKLEIVAKYMCIKNIYTFDFIMMIIEKISKEKTISIKEIIFTLLKKGELALVPSDKAERDEFDYINCRPEYDEDGNEINYDKEDFVKSEVLSMMYEDIEIEHKMIIDNKLTKSEWKQHGIKEISEIEAEKFGEIIAKGCIDRLYEYEKTPARNEEIMDLKYFRNKQKVLDEKLNKQTEEFFQI